MANENENEIKEGAQTPPPVSESKKEESKTDKFLELARQARDNSVSKEDYDKVVKDNEKLQQYILEGKELEKKVEKPQKSIADLRKELKREGINNLDYVSAALELRKEILEKEGRDIFSSSVDDAPQAQKVGETLESWIKQADGNPAMFNAILEQNVTDDPALLANLAKLRKKAK